MEEYTPSILDKIELEYLRKGITTGKVLLGKKQRAEVAAWKSANPPTRTYTASPEAERLGLEIKDVQKGCIQMVFTDDEDRLEIVPV